MYKYFIKTYKVEDDDHVVKILNGLGLQGYRVVQVMEYAMPKQSQIQTPTNQMGDIQVDKYMRLYLEKPITLENDEPTPQEQDHSSG